MNIGVRTCLLLGVSFSVLSIIFALLKEKGVNKNVRFTYTLLSIMLIIKWNCSSE